MHQHDHRTSELGRAAINFRGGSRPGLDRRRSRLHRPAWVLASLVSGSAVVLASTGATGAVAALPSAVQVPMAPTGAETTEELVVNGSLAQGEASPDCFFTAGWGERTVQGELVDDAIGELLADMAGGLGDGCPFPRSAGQRARLG